MSLINYDRIVGIQIPVIGGFSQQDAISHKLDKAIFVVRFHFACHRRAL